MIGSDENPAATNARPMTYALLVPQSPYSNAPARFQSRLRGRCTPALASRTISSISCAIAYWRRISIARSFTGKLFLGATLRLTANRVNQMFWRFFVSLNGSASGRSNGGTKFRPANAVRIGANDARHREHLMAPARQLTSSASLKGKGCREIRLLEVRRLVARGGLV